MAFFPGDRVELVDQTPQNFSMRNGIVVHYRGKHSTKEPRVRWASGWGTSCKEAELRHMHDDEREQPMPTLASIDHPY